jgi:DNA primase
VSVDRDALLDRTDLAALADELLGLHRGRGPSANWPCPDPQHGPQTGRTPPVSIFTSRAGIARWHCHGCGAGGTAIDLVMTTQHIGVRDAIAWLAHRTGLRYEAPRVVPARPGPQPAPPELPPLRARSDEVRAYVTACEHHLWTDHGDRWRAWLAARGFSEAVLRANRVGADPGPRFLDRPAGLPRRGAAVVFPVLTPDREPAYLQARYLDVEAAGRKYDNPAEALAPNPRVALVHTPRASARGELLVVCEGLPDALTVAGTGLHAAAVLGAALPDTAVAQRVAQLAAGRPVVIAFDADPSGKRGAQRLDELLAPTHRAPVVTLDLPPGADVNDWARHAGARFAREFSTHLAHQLPRPVVAPAPALAP